MVRKSLATGFKIFRIQVFPRDTIQRRLPDPEWLEHWPDTQIRFDLQSETSVVDRILHNLEPDAMPQTI